MKLRIIIILLIIGIILPAFASGEEIPSAKVSPLFLISGAGMILVALFSVIYWKKYTSISFSIFLWGALAWFIGVTLKLIFFSLINPIIIPFLYKILAKSLADPLTWIYIGLLSGVFECGMTLVFALYYKKARQGWAEATGFGLGFGTIEAFIVGLASLGSVITLLYFSKMLPSQTVALMSTSLQSLSIIPAPIVERIIVILIHALSCVMIIYAVITKRWRWFWISFFYKSAIDTIAAFGQISFGITDPSHLWILEAMLLPFGLIGLWGIMKFKNKFPKEKPVNFGVER